MISGLTVKPHLGLLEIALISVLLQLACARHVPLSSRREWVALFELRSSLGLRERDWPREVDPCKRWAGVECRIGRVTGINISGLKRTNIGKLNPTFAVDSLSNLTFLASFNASGFTLPGPIPDWFGHRLSALRVLDLRSSSVTDPIPPSLGYLRKLKFLYLSNNSLAGSIPEALGQLSMLSVLDLGLNVLTGSIPSTFSSLHKLTRLDLSSNYIHGSIPPGLGTLSILRFLNLSGNSIAEQIPTQLGNLSQLIELDLSHNLLCGSLPEDLAGLRSLRKMVVGNNFLEGPLPSDLFPSLTQLQFLSLCCNKFNHSLPAVLWTMPNLDFLDISNNNLTGVLPNLSSSVKFMDAMFNVSENMFYGGLSSSLSMIGSVDLSSNYFQGKVPHAKNATMAKNCLGSVPNQRSLEDCRLFYAARNLTFDNFGEQIIQPHPSLPNPPHTSNKRRVVILVCVFGGTCFVVVLLLLLIVLLRMWNKNGANQRNNANVGSVPEGGSSIPLRDAINFLSVGESFAYEQLVHATDNFNSTNLIKHGHSGDLFQGVLKSGIPVVVKRVDLHSHKKEYCMLELELFSKASHTRLVPFLGHCLENESEKLLVYKLMPNGDLSNSLYRPTSLEVSGLESLDWITRLKIAIGAAEGLSYLHHECTPSLVHRDVQASSILLDDKFEVRLGSLSEACAQVDHQTDVITRMLRMPPTHEHSPTAPATWAYDVYCFGKVLLQLVTGKLGVRNSEDNATKEWLEQTLPYISRSDRELLNTIIDPSLIVDEGLLEEVWAMAIVAKSCLNPKPAKRPLMRYVLRALENPLKVVREENSVSARFRTTSSRRSWSAAFFGSWRQSSSESSTNGNEFPFSKKRLSSEIFPEPVEMPDEVTHHAH